MSPSIRKSPGPRPSSIPSGILIHPAFWPQQTWAENWGLCPFFGWGESWVPIKHSVAGAEVYLLAKFHLDPSSRLATIHQRHIQTGQDRQTDDGLTAMGEPFYKRSPKKLLVIVIDVWFCYLLLLKYFKV